MRKLTRTALATTAVAGLLALPVAGAGAAQGTSTGSMSLTGASGGTLSISVPNKTATDPADFGSAQISALGAYETNGLGTVTVSDTRTGLIRTIVLTTANALDDGTASFCQDANDDPSDGFSCSAAAGDTIPLANSLYKFNSPSTSGTALSVTPDLTNTGTPVGTAAASWVVTAGTFTAVWNPTFAVTLVGTENAGTFYGSVTHSVSSS